MDEQKLNELKVAFPRGTLFELGGQEFFIRPPSRDEYRRFQQDAGDDAKRPAALESMALCCTVYPSAGPLGIVLDQFPAYTAKLFNGALELAGSEQKLVKKG